MKKHVLAFLVALCATVLACALVGCGGSSSSSASSKSQSEGTHSLSASDTTASSTAATSKVKNVYGEEVSLEPKGVKNILVIGDDEWETYKPGHADLMFLMRVDFDNHTITQVTVPRDTKWQFDDGTFGKLNYVYTGKGAEAQTRAAAEIVGEPIDFYVVINFDGLEKIVDHFGGIEMDLPYGAEYSFYTKDYPNEVFSAGQQVLNGWRAMAISRTRTGYEETVGADSPQVAIRQYVDRMMFRVLMQYAYSSSEGIDGLFNAFQGNIKSNIPVDAQINWAKALGSTGEIKVIGTTGPYNGGIDEEAGGQWLVLTDREGWKGVMAAVNANASPDEIETAINESFAANPYPAGISIVTESTITTTK